MDSLVGNDTAHQMNGCGRYGRSMLKTIAFWVSVLHRSLLASRVLMLTTTAKNVSESNMFLNMHGGLRCDRIDFPAAVETEMTAKIKGGPAAVYGILYQVVGALHWATVRLSNVRLNGTDELEEVTITLEPERGGDLQVCSSNCRVIEQWKTRRTKSNWTVREVMSDVVPNLYLAADCIEESCTFRFVSNAAVADWSEVAALSLRIAAQAKVNGSSDGSCSHQARTKFFVKGSEMSDEEFVDVVVGFVEQKLKRENLQEPRSTIHKKLLFVLANLEIKANLSVAALESEIDQALTLLVDHEEDVPDKRNQLVGRILGLSGMSDTDINPLEFLKNAGLSSVSLRDWPRIRANLLKCIHHEAHVVLGYNRELNVRPSPQQLSEKCTLFHGESGTGKSWQLGAVAESCSENTACVLIRSRGDFQRNLEAAAQVVNYDGLHRERPIHFSPLCRKILRFSKAENTPWLHLLIDDVQRAAELREILAFDWSSLGVRVAVSCSDRLAAGLKDSPEELKLKKVGAFTQGELRRYLQKRNQTWRSIRPDVRALIQLPQLASIYCDVATEVDWHPENEYELFRRSWEQISLDHRQQDHPVDMPGLRKLAGTLLANVVVYPWEYSDCGICGLMPESVSRLERIGWLKQEEGRIRFAHTRLINWAIAEYLADRCRRADLNSELAEVISIIGRITKNPVVGGQNLGYVAMDFLWLITDESHPARSHAHKVIPELEAAQAQPYHPESLYRYQLATIGPRIIESLVRRLRLTADDERSTHRFLVAAALLDIASTRYGDLVADSAAEFLDPQVPAVADCACRVLKGVPRGAAAVKVWEYYVKYFDGPPETHPKRFSVTEPLEALIAVTKKNVAWIDTTLLKEKETTRVLVLGMLLWRVPDAAADKIWEVHRERLLLAMAEDHRELACAIERFSDRTSATGAIGKLLSFKHWQRSFLLRGMAVVCPTELLDAFEAAPHLLVSQNHRWVLPLIQHDHDRFNLIVRRAIINEPELVHELCQVYWHCPNAMTEEVAYHLVDSLVSRCDCVDSGKADDKDFMAIATICDVLCGITHPHLLNVLREKRNLFCNGLLALLSQRSDDSNAFFFQRELRLFLLKVGGEAFAAHVNQGLQHESQMERALAIDWAGVVSSSETRDLLIAQTHSSELYAHSVPQAPYLQRKAATVLAALGADEEVVASILKHDGHISAIVKARAKQPHFSDEICGPAWQGIVSEAEDDRIKAWHALAVSGRSDFVPRLLTAMENLDPESAEAQAILYALMILKAGTPDAINVYVRHLRFSKNRWLACRGLLNSGRSDVAEILSDYVDQFDTEAVMTSDDSLAVLLSESESTKVLAAEFAWKSFNNNQTFTPFRDPRMIRSLGVLKREDVREFLYEEAHPSIHSEVEHGRRAAAIHALSTIDKHDAFEAASLALRESKVGRERYPGLLIELDPNSAVSLLVEKLMDEPEGIVRRAIAVALRPWHSKAEELIRYLSQSEQPRRRSVAAWLIGWFPPSFLPNQLEGMLGAETVIDVRSRILDSIFMRKNQVVASYLLARLPDSDVSLQWCYAECLFELVPPEMLGASADDELWILRNANSLPPLLRAHIAFRYENLMRNTKSRSEINDFLTGP
jgi:hypothetical protein